MVYVVLYVMVYVVLYVMVYEVLYVTMYVVLYVTMYVVLYVMAYVVFYKSSSGVCDIRHCLDNAQVNMELEQRLLQATFCGTMAVWVLKSSLRGATKL